jgi:hypothetical protein
MEENTIQRRLKNIKAVVDELGVEGIFAKDGAEGLSPQEMADLLFKAGVLKEPTVEALLKGVEDELRDMRLGRGFYADKGGDTD